MTMIVWRVRKVKTPATSENPTTRSGVEQEIARRERVRLEAGLERVDRAADEQRQRHGEEVADHDGQHAEDGGIAVPREVRKKAEERFHWFTL